MDNLYAIVMMVFMCISQVSYSTAKGYNFLEHDLTCHVINPSSRDYGILERARAECDRLLLQTTDNQQLLFSFLAQRLQLRGSSPEPVVTQLLGAHGIPISQSSVTLCLFTILNLLAEHADKPLTEEVLATIADRLNGKLASIKKQVSYAGYGKGEKEKQPFLRKRDALFLLLGLLGFGVTIGLGVKFALDSRERQREDKKETEERLAALSAQVAEQMSNQQALWEQSKNQLRQDLSTSVNVTQALTDRVRDMNTILNSQSNSITTIAHHVDDLNQLQARDAATMVQSLQSLERRLGEQVQITDSAIRQLRTSIDGDITTLQRNINSSTNDINGRITTIAGSVTSLEHQTRGQLERLGQRMNEESLATRDYLAQQLDQGRGDVNRALSQLQNQLVEIGEQQRRVSNMQLFIQALPAVTDTIGRIGAGINTAIEGNRNYRLRQRSLDLQEERERQQAEQRNTGGSSDLQLQLAQMSGMVHMAPVRDSFLGNRMRTLGDNLWSTARNLPALEYRSSNHDDGEIPGLIDVPTGPVFMPTVNDNGASGDDRDQDLLRRLNALRE